MTTEAPQGGARLLSEVGQPGRWIALDEHRRRHQAPPKPGRRPGSEIIRAVQAAELRGRGGAGFPTAVKLKAVADRRGPATVLANGAEGEPASGKDKLLLSAAPHLVLDGAQWAAAAVGASQIVLAVDRTSKTAMAQVERAIAERAAREPDGVPVRMVATPPRYVAGEESALVHWLNGGPAKPTLVPPRPFERGVDGRPTLVDNVETLAHLAQICQWGPDWFRGRGTADEPGTALVTVSGGVAKPGVYEVPFGASLPKVLATAGAGPVSAVLVGGYFGTWLSAAQAEKATLSKAGLEPLGASLGCGVLAVLPEGVCGVHDSARVLRWLAAETAGQCGPCVHGLAALSNTLIGLYQGKGGSQARAHLDRWAAMVERRGACHHPDGAIRFLRSALAVFDHELTVHARTGRCSYSGSKPILPVPAVSSEPEWR